MLDVYLVRWIHILCACLAVGAPFFVRFALIPALPSLDDAQRSRLHDEIVKRWRIIVYIAITLFLVTGFYNFLVIKRWANWPAEFKTRYHMYFGIKFLCALGMFFLASALAGRTQGLAGIRKNAKLWYGVLIVLGIAVIVISGTMRFMEPPATPAPAAVLLLNGVATTIG